MAIQKIARKDSDFRVVCMLPDFCFLPMPPTPPQVPPIPFPLTTDLGKAKAVAKDVKINKKPAFVFDASYVPETFGDEPADPPPHPGPGTRKKGVLSQTAGEAAWPMTHSSSVKIRGEYIIRAGDMFYMNNKYKGRLKKKCPACKASMLAGLPVNPILGIKVLPDETDFAFEGVLPLVWQRSYYSDQDGAGWLGEGWSVPGGQRLIRTESGLAYIDLQGRLIPMPDMEDGEEPVLFEAEMVWFARDGSNYFVTSLDGSVSLRFAPAVVSEEDPEGEACLNFPLVAVEDSNGNHQRFIYHHLTGLPQYIIDGNGRVFYLDFGNVGTIEQPAYRLLSVSLLDRLPALEEKARPARPLVRYEYAATGDLLRVIGRDGALKRSFTYKNNLMVSHTNAGGLTSYYEYSHYTPTGKVLRNWSSLGHEWRFTYHEGYTEVTDVLGRTEQYHYDDNQELIRHVLADGSSINMERDRLGRLTAHTDALGRTTRYQYSREGQVTTITRPDGNALYFDYDDSYRLRVSTDANGDLTSYVYDAAGNPIIHTDPQGNATRFAYQPNGLLQTVTDPLGHTTEYHYNTNNQPDLITDCSGYQTRLSYTPEGQPARITDALGQHTEYYYDDDLRLIRADYPDGSRERFSYDTAGNLVAHTDGEGHTTEYRYAADGLPTERKNALGYTFGYQYDPARRLIGLTNENGARYRFSYDPLDRLIAEAGFDQKLTAYHYNQGGELTQQTEYGRLAENEAVLKDLFARSSDRHQTDPKACLKDKTPLRITEFQRDTLGRLIASIAHDQQGGTQETLFQYDAEGRLVRAADPHSITGFDYDANGRILQESFRFHRPEVDQSNALPPTDWRNPDHDLILQHTHRNVRYVYDANGNRTATHLPNGQRLDYLYYGSGHLHQISLNGNPLTDIERDKLHREIQRSQGKLNSRYQLDPLGRLKQQTAELQSLSETGSKAQTITAVKRSYGYDKTGNLTQSTDQRFGTTHYAYDQLGRITQAGEQRFAFDPAHNIVDKADQSVKDNLVTHYEGNQYVYDEYGNLIYRELPNGEIQKYQYDLKDQLVKAEIHQNGQQQTWRYTYDAIGRRIAKEQIENDPPRIFGEEACLKEAQPIAGSRTEFIWDGSHLLQETNNKGTYTYVYTDQDSYEPLAQIFDSKDPEQPQQTHYFHCDQIGIPREMTDKEGNLLWFGNYKGWGQLDEETNITGAHQPFRLQNQYCDEETGLHYNFFRYYEPQYGRFVNQDPIGLNGGENLYQFALHSNSWLDPLGLAKKYIPSFERHLKKQGTRKGKDFTAAGKRAVRDQNKADNKGQMICGVCGRQTVEPKRHEKGKSPPDNEAHVDHILAKAKGGSGTVENGQVLCRVCNLAKSDK